MTAPPDRPEHPPWTLRRRLTALCLLVAVVLVFLAVGAATTALANRGELDRLLDSIAPMRTASNELQASLTAQDRSVRAYVLSRDEAERATYEDAVATQQRDADTIANSRAATPEIKADVAKVTQLADIWRATVTGPAMAVAASGDREQAAGILANPGAARFAELTAAVTTMQGHMQAVRDGSVASIRDTSSTLLFVLIVAVILAIAGTVGLLVALQYAVIEPVTHLAAQVRSVARGRYGQQIAASGPPELANLASDVETMRRRIASDLAEVEAARRQIEQANALLEMQAAELTRSNGDLEQFAYVASHDLQEPLRKVSSFCQLLQRRYSGQLDERADQYIAFAVSGAQRMQRLINDLLAFSRVGRITTGFTEVDLNRLAEESVRGLDLEGGEVTWSDLPVVRGEESLLSTLLGNLIGNSLKFRRPDLPPRVRLSARRVDDTWEISCEDNGIGIEPEFAEKVFVIFQRLHPHDAYAGTGIGLAIAKKIVEYHGGRIWLDPDHGDGAAIRFTLSTVDEPAPVETAVREKEPVA
jgi:signal transduction histidine kinase